MLKDEMRELVGGYTRILVKTDSGEPLPQTVAILEGEGGFYYEAGRTNFAVDIDHENCRWTVYKGSRALQTYSD